MDPIKIAIRRIERTDYGEGGWWTYLDEVRKVLELARYKCAGPLTYTHQTLPTWHYNDGQPCPTYRFEQKR